jgi:hypothetical protein
MDRSLPVLVRDPVDDSAVLVDHPVKDIDLPAVAREGHNMPAFTPCATAGTLRMTSERRLVDGRRLELPTSALRTNAGSGRIS